MKRLWSAFKRLWPSDARVRRHSLFMLVVLLAALGVRAADVRESLPYPRHPDETTWANIALHMLRTGDLNPHRFRKPSLPVYMMLGGFSVGLLRAEMAGDVKSVRDLGASASAYYLVPQAAEIPKNLFSLASVLSLGLAGFIGFRLTQQPILLWLVPLLASASASFYRFSWSYMNVDIIGAFFAMCTVAYLVRERVRDVPEGRSRGGYRCAIISGVLAGLTVGSKYNLFPILVPCVLWFLLYESRPFWGFFFRCAVVGAASFVAFLLTTPYAVLDFRSFYSDLMKEAHHYATGHPGATVDAGVPMLITYFSHFLENFGAIPFVLSIAGIAILAQRDWRLTLMAFSYPFAFVAYMSMQTVFFERNVVVVHLFVALALAATMVLGPGIVARAVLRRWPSAKEPKIWWATTGGVALLVLVGLPWERVARAYSSGLDPRNQAAQWVTQNVDAGTKVIIDKQVAMDVRSLTKRYDVLETELPHDIERIEKLGEGKEHLIVISRESERGKYSKPLRGDKARARFARPADKLGAAEVRALTILERPER